MYQGLLHTHSMFRWLMLVTILFAIVLAATGWVGSRKWNKTDNLTGLILTILADLQLVTGLLLYFVASPITKEAMKDFGAAMKNDVLRFMAVEHIIMMLLAVILIHIGRYKSKKALPDKSKHRVSAIYYIISLLLMLAAIPWDRI
jgi:hypothetical protein